MNENINTFRAITNDNHISDQQILKYYKWGKGNLQQALNYYYRRKQKQQKSKEGSKIDQKLKEKSNVFVQMNRAMIKQKKTQQFISTIRQEYQLPIKGRTQLCSNKSSNKQAIQKQYELNEFQDADYLPDAFKAQQQEGGIQQQQYKNNQYRGYTKQYTINHQMQYYQKNEKENKIQFMDIQESSYYHHHQIQNKNKVQVDFRKKNIDKYQILNSQQQISREQKKQKQYQEQQQQNVRIIKQSQIQIQKTKQQIKRFDYIMNQPEIFLGDVIINGFAIKFQHNFIISQGQPLQFRYFIQQQKKKKTIKSIKKTQKNMNMRLVYGTSQFGRLKDQQVRIFLPLVVNNMIRIQMFAFTIPKRLDYYTNLKIKANIYLLKKAITDPVVQTFQGHSDLIISIYKPVAEQIINLFDRLQLPIKTWPLIKKKSKLRNNNQSHSFLIKTHKRQENMTQLQDERKKLQQKQLRQRNDPFFKTIQKNINDMFKNKEDSNGIINKMNNNPIEKSQVKKKIIELKMIQQDKCAQLVDLYEEDLQPYEPSANFISHLYTYQALALSWMMRRQGHHQEKLKEKDQLHPLWTEFQVKSTNHRLFINQLTSQISIKPPMCNSKCLGGILADQMGLGKTVMMAALISTTNKHQTTKSKKSKSNTQGKNLVIVPLTLLSQWQAQLKRHTKNTKTLIYYAQQRKKHVNDLHTFNVIITTYGTVSHQFSKGFHISKTGIYKYKWERIILDQAHYIKGRIIQTSKAVYQLDGVYRWCLTGTPIQNNLTDMFSLLHFIRYTPWSQYQCWNKYINKPIEAGDENVYEVLRSILKRVFLRRTKQSKDHQGKPIVQLPNKISRIQLLQMNTKQRQFYDKLYESSKLKIRQLQQKGILEAKYMQIFELLIRLRQICCHPILYKSITKFVTDASKFQDEVKKFIKKRGMANEENVEKYYQPIMEGEEEVRVQVANGNNISQCYIKQTLSKIERQQFENCLICLGQVQDPVITVCLHIFCKTCAIRQIQQCGICSACRKRLTRQDFIYLPRENRFNQNLYDNSRYTRSTKILAILEHLQTLKPSDKVVIFSQFLGMLDLIQHQLKQEKISYLRMEGSTSHKERTRIVQTFQKDPTVQVFIVSLKTAGVGLNLVAANKVFLVDPWWNPGVEDQAIERVHRIGQTRQVQIIRFIMDQTIEMRMVELNTNKKQLSTKVLSQQGSIPSQSRFQKLKYLMQKY